MKIEREFDPDRRRRSLTKLTPRKRVLFALACSERLYPNYLAFVAKHEWGDREALRAALGRRSDTPHRGSSMPP